MKTGILGSMGHALYRALQGTVVPSICAVHRCPAAGGSCLIYVTLGAFEAPDASPSWDSELACVAQRAFEAQDASNTAGELKRMTVFSQPKAR